MKNLTTAAEPPPSMSITGPGRWALQCSCLAIAAVFATPAFAQVLQPPATTGPAAAPATTVPTKTDQQGGADQIGEVVVTARRVSERLQEIPASVSAITGDQVARLTSLDDIQSMVSGVTFKSFGPIPTVGIRGFGNRTQAASPANSTVGIFQDGVFVAPSLVTLASRIDTERVEVAKGPQSTLYGRSSFTGAINIVSNDPAKTFGGYLDAGYGGSSVHGENLWHVRGAVSIPLTDTLSLRVFGLREKRDGFTYDDVTGNRSNSYDRDIVRARLLWEPNDLLTARLTGTIIRDNLPQGSVHSGRTPAPLGQNIVFGDPTNAAERSALQFGATVWDAQYQVPQRGVIHGEQGTLDLRFKTPLGELASLTDYQHSYQGSQTSLDLTRLNFAVGLSPYEENRWSQELRLSNKIGRFSYLVGGYYLHSKAQQDGGASVDRALPFGRFGPGSSLYDLAGFQALYQPVETRTNAYAGFGQLGYDITDKLNLTVGLREARDELSGPAATYFLTRTNILVPSTPTINRQAAFDATTGDANLNYKLRPDVIAYASYSRGNSPGGLNVGGAARANFGAQNVDAFELGLKSQLLNRRLQLNVALFDNEYDKLQLTQNVFINGALTALITNAGSARGRGVDLDALAVVTSNLRLGVQYTYADSKITQYTVPPAPAPQVDFTGVPLVRSPKHSFNGSATYTHDIGPGKFQFTAEETYSSSYTNDYQGVPAGTTYPGRPGVPPGVTTTQVLGLFRTPGYALTNLNASYTWRNWEVSGYVRNLFNHQYIAAVLGFDALTYPSEQPGEPQTFEVSVKYSF